MSYEPLTDLQWQVFEPLFPTQEKRGRGKPHTPWRTVLNSIFWVLTTGGKWDAIPKESHYASKSAAHRWYCLWEKTGMLAQLLKTYQGLTSVAETVHPQRRNRKPREEYPCCEVLVANNQ